MKTKSLLTAGLLIGACNAHAQLNVMNALHSAQTLIQPSQNATSESPAIALPAVPASKQNQLSGNLPTFDQMFGCGQPAAHSVLSTFAVHNVKLGDVCAQPELTTGAPIGMVRSVEDSLGKLAPTQNVALTQLTGDGSTVGLATVRAVARPPGLAKSVVVTVSEHLNAADTTNSLQPGNSLRAALEQKYGKPTKVIGAREKLAIDHKVNETQIKARSQALGINSDEAIAKSVEYEDQVTKQWVACHPADTIYELQWSGQDGTLLTAKLSDGECGANPSFDVTLVPNPNVSDASRFLWSSWVEPVGAFQKEQTQARSVNAPTPKL
jgi:hypothetical protein